MKADCECPGEFPQLLLKVSRDKEALGSESDRANKSSAKFAGVGLFVRTVGNELVESNGWSAIGYEFDLGSQTLRTWLGHEGLGRGRVELVLSQLFLDEGLKIGYTRNVEDREINFARAVWQDVLSGPRRARIRAVINQLSSLGRVCKRGDMLGGWYSAL
jgi:hypothetical protein